MSKTFFKGLMRDKKEGNFFFSSIRNEWARESKERADNWKWSTHINPSSTWLTFEGCPYEGVRLAATPRKASEADSIQYMETGNYIHRMFQERAMTIPDLLWPKPVFATPHENEKLEKAWPEWPFYWKEYELSGRADHVLKYKDAPAVIDIKIPQREEGSAWETYKSKLPEPTHMTQSCMGALALKRMGISNPEWVGVVYFNPYIPSQGNKGYVEYYEKFDTLLEEKTMLLLVHAKKERDAFLAGEESSCTYPLCRKHRKEDNK